MSSKTKEVSKINLYLIFGSKIKGDFKNKFKYDFLGLEKQWRFLVLEKQWSFELDLILF